MNLCLKACPMRSRSSLENLPSGYVRLTKSPQMRSMSSSLMLWSSAMGSGQSGSGCRNASAMPSTSVRPSRWEIHRRATRGSVRCGGRAASHSDVGMPSARHCGVVMLLVGVENSWPRDPKRLVCGWSWVMPRRRLRADFKMSGIQSWGKWMQSHVFTQQKWTHKLCVVTPLVVTPLFQTPMTAPHERKARAAH
jgi:hypothetical protein